MDNNSTNIGNLISPDIINKVGGQNITSFGAIPGLAPITPALATTKQVTDIYSELKSTQKKVSSDLTSAKSSMSKEEKQSQKDKNSKILKNVTKSLAIALSIPLTNTLIGLVVGNKDLKKLVNDTNIIIDAAHTKSTLEQARIKHDSAYNLLNKQYNIIQNIKNILTGIETALVILTIIITILKANPLVSKNPIIQSKIDKYQIIINELTLILGIIIVCLQHELGILIDLENQLHQLGTILETNTQTSPDFSSLMAAFQFSTQPPFGTFNGFTFAVKEDNTPGQTVAGNKRHYAVALDSTGVAVLKSDMSFTTDYQVLVDSLKLIITQQNLQG